MIRTASPVRYKQGVPLKSTSKVFTDRAEADEYARDKRSYVAPAVETDEKTGEEEMTWYVPA